MPTIPKASDDRILPGIRPAPRQNPGVVQPVGAEIGQAVSRATQQIGAVVNAEREDANRTVVFDKWNKHQQAMNQVLWGENGAMTTEGENAFTQPERVAKDYRKVADELESELTAPEQKVMFRQMVDRQFPDTERSVMVHAGREKEKYRQQTFNSTVANLQTTAINSLDLPTAPQEIQQALLKGQATRALQNPGMSKEALATVNAADASNLHTDIVRTYLSRGQYDRAEAYYQGVSKDIQPDQRTALEGPIREGAQRSQALKVSDSIITSDAGDSRATAFAEAAKISDPDQRLRVETRLDQHFTRRDQARREANTVSFKEATDTLDSTGGDLSAIPVQQWQSFDLDDRQRLEARAGQLRKQVEIPDGATSYWQIRQMMSVPELSRQFSQMDLTKLNTEMSKRDLSDLMERQADFRARGANADSIKGINSEEQVINQTLVGAGINPTMSTTNPDSKRVVAFRNALQTAVLAESATQKRQLKPEEVGKLAGKLMATQRVTKTGLFWDSQIEVPLFETPGFQGAALTMEQIPQDRAQQIRAKFEASKQPFTDEDVLSYYNDNLNPNSATNTAPPAPNPIDDIDSFQGGGL